MLNMLVRNVCSTVSRLMSLRSGQISSIAELFTKTESLHCILLMRGPLRTRGQGLELPLQTRASLSGFTSAFNFLKTGNTPCTQSADRPLGEADVIYPYYPFLSADTMHKLAFEDLQYLEKLSCYRVPSRPLLDEFVKAYFCYIHPHQPILDEDSFRQAYINDSSNQTPTFSIFVLQAMLVSACSVCTLPPGIGCEIVLMS